MKNMFLLAFGVVVANGDAVTEVDPSSLKDMLKSDVKCVFTEFYAPWCGHCKELAPKYEFVGDRMSGEKDVEVVKIDADKHAGGLADYGVAGFPTVILFKNGADKDKGRTTVKYESAREAKHMITFLNKHCGSSVSTEGFKNKRQKQDRNVPPEMLKLFDAFTHLNKFQFKQANAAMDAIAAGDGRTAKSAGRMLDKFTHLGAKVTGLQMDEWLQVDMETYEPPTVGEVDDKIYLVARLDFRSGQRGQLEPALEEAQELGVVVVRYTGTSVEIDDDISYAVAKREKGKCVDGDAVLAGCLNGMHDALIIKNGRVLWSGHCGIIDDDLLDTLKLLVAGVDVEQYVDQLVDSDVVFEGKKHDEL